MNHRSSRTIGCLAILTILTIATTPNVGLGFSGGPPDGVAGDPPAFSNCTNCHSSFPVNSGIGTLELIGLPASYSPGVTYPLTISIQDAEPNRMRWGFEATVIRDSDGLRGGVLAPTNPTQVQVSVGAGDDRDYIKHLAAGTFPGQTAGATWDIEWTAPAALTGSVHFYLAGNAANNANGNQQDYIYTIDALLSESTSDVELPPIAVDYLNLRTYPNPSPGERVVQFSLPEPAALALRVVDANGRTIRNLASGDFAEGDYRLDWDGLDGAGRPLPAGVYFTVLKSTLSSRASTERILIVR